MAKTKWTMKKKKKTKPLKDITSPLKDVEIPKEKKKNDANLVEGKEKEANHVEDKESEMETNTNEENETEERVEDEANEANTVQSDAEEDRLEEERPEEEEEERPEEEEEERSEEEKEEEANKDDVEVNEENSGKENEKERSEEEENEEEEANLDENNPPAANVQSNDGGREEGGRAEGLEGFDEEEPAAIKPLGMYFPPSEYRKKIKISTRCFIADVLKTLGELQPPMTPVEKSWFETHPQFKHIFHMPQAGNHKVMGMWMLLLRTVRIVKEKEAWFAVNGCPIRYGIREHALISGLNCRNYPLNYKQSGGTNFLRKYFGHRVVRYHDVKAMVQRGMEPGRYRLKLLVLLSFDYMLRQISNTMSHFDGEVKEGVIWPVPGFCIPMELLAFEAIEKLGLKFREEVPVEDVHPTCPRMCRSKFKRSEMKGFPLAKINKALSETTDIENILACTDEEKTLLGRITEPEDIRDKDDTIVESWMKCLDRGYVVRFEDMFQEDVAARQDPPPQIGNETEATNEAGGNTVKLDELVQVINSFKESIEGRLTKIEEKVGEIDSRLAASEGFVQELLDGRNVDADMEDEQGISKRSRNKTKDISSRAKKKSKKN
ncbi:hypothetical protein Bca101_019294 [Brassica carinata]